MGSKKLRIGAAAIMLGGLALAGCARTGTPERTGGVREVKIDMLDTLRFEPDRIEVAKGETVRFVLTNRGKQQHEFYLADEEAQMAHAEEMKESGGRMEDMDGMHMGEAMAAMMVDPGKTRRVEVTFEETGTIPFGCHVPGHYEAGMKGTVEVS